VEELKKIPGICPICKKPNTPILLSGNENKIGTPCSSCLDTLVARKPASIVCRKCGRLAAYMDPGIAANGFIFHPERTYHVPACKNCTPGYNSFDEIDEMIEYSKNHKE